MILFLIQFIDRLTVEACKKYYKKYNYIFLIFINKNIFEVFSSESMTKFWGMVQWNQKSKWTWEILTMTFEEITTTLFTAIVKLL